MLPEQVYDALAAAADGVDPAEATWEELKPRVLEAAGVSSEQDDPLLYQVVYTIEQYSNGDQRELLGSTDRMWQMVSDSAAAVETAPEDTSAEPATEAARADATAPEPYWDGEKWLTYDAAAGQWVPMEPAAVAVEEVPAPTTDEVYDQLVAQMVAEDPAFAEELANDPVLQEQIRAEVVAQLG